MPLTAAERLAAAQAAAALCEQLEEAMEALMGVDQFSDGAAVLLEVLDLLSGGGQGAAAVATPDCQRSLTGALQVCKRKLSEKLQSEKSLLPKLLKAVREGLREATRKVGSGGGGETFLEKETIAGLTAFKVRVCTTAAAHAFSTSHPLSLTPSRSPPFPPSLSPLHTHRTN